MGSFNSREIASAIWLIVFFVFALRKAEFRESIARVPGAVLKHWILAWVCLMASYTVGVVSLLSTISLWNWSLLKDTIVWFCLTGVVTCAGCIIASDGKNVFVRILVGSLRTAVLIEFLLNTYTFSLGVELVLVPLLTLLVVVGIIAESDPQLSTVAKLTGTVQSLVGFAVLAYVVNGALSDLKSLGSVDTLRSALLPPLLSMLFSPFVYFAVLEARYESLFANLSIGEKKGEQLKRYAKRRIVMHCRLSLRRVEELHRRQGYCLIQAGSKADIDSVFQHGKQA